MNNQATQGTTEQRKPLRSNALLCCPLCGNRANVTRLNHPNSKPTYNISCGVQDDDSDACGLVLFGGYDTRKDMVAKWNRRAT